MKRCIKCNEVKEISLFVKGKNSCKSCISIYKKELRIKNLEKNKLYFQEYYKENKDLIKNNQKVRYNEDKSKKIEYQKKYSEINKDKIKEYKKEYYIENKESINEYKREYQNNRRKNDPIFKLKYSINRMIRRSLKVKGVLKSSKSVDILGCDIQSFKLYLENLFTGEMSWENYGTFWDIDHKIPLATAKSEDDVIRLNHYTNLQPLNSYINRVVKRDKVNFS